MTLVEFYSKEECGLCDEARKLLKQLGKEFSIQVREIKLTEDHPKFKEFMLAIPVVVVNGKKKLTSTIREEELRAALKEVNPPTRLFHAAKFLEALGFLTVAVGLMYGVMGNMWIELYFFIAGVAIFLAGRGLEKREMKRERYPSPPEDLLLKS